MEFPNVPGFGFYPTDDEILQYLKCRVEEHIHGYPNSVSDSCPDVDLYQFNPWDLPNIIRGLLRGNPNQHEWYFFCPRNDTNRTVPGVGYWNVTGRRQTITSAETGEVLGTKSILVFRGSGHRENGSRVVHEYHLDPSYLGYNINQMPFVACCLKNN